MFYDGFMFMAGVFVFVGIVVVLSYFIFLVRSHFDTDDEEEPGEAPKERIHGENDLLALVAGDPENQEKLRPFVAVMAAEEIKSHRARKKEKNDIPSMSTPELCERIIRMTSMLDIALRFLQIRGVPVVLESILSRDAAYPNGRYGFRVKIHTKEKDYEWPPR